MADDKIKSVRLEKETHKILKLISVEHEVTITDFINELVKYINERKDICKEVIDRIKKRKENKEVKKTKDG